MQIELFSGTYEIIVVPRSSMMEKARKMGKKNPQGYIDWSNKEIYINPKGIVPGGIRQILLHEIFHRFVKQFGGTQREDTIDAIAQGIALELEYGLIDKVKELETQIEVK